MTGLPRMTPPSVPICTACDHPQHTATGCMFVTRSWGGGPTYCCCQVVQVTPPVLAAHPQQCPATSAVPTVVAVDALSQRETGYPNDAVAACCRTAGHDGRHFTALPLANNPGSFSWRWT